MGSVPDWAFDDEDECPNCGGEGFVSSCFEEWACMHPDEGCDLCTHRCDWCSETPRKPEPPTGGRMDE